MTRRRRAAIVCRLFGHHRWYYDEPETHDFVFGCVRCKDPALVTDRQPVVKDPARPGYVRIETGFLDRMRARLEMLK